MTDYPYYEEYSAKTKLNIETRFIIILIVAIVMGGIVAYIIGFQQGSVTTNAVNNTKETEQPTYIERSSENEYVGYDYPTDYRYGYEYPTNYGYYQYPTYYTYNYESTYSNNRNYCSPWLAEAYRDGCPDTGPVRLTLYPDP